jgi:hypothetical protein
MYSAIIEKTRRSLPLQRVINKVKVKQKKRKKKKKKLIKARCCNKVTSFFRVQE